MRLEGQGVVPETAFEWIEEAVTKAVYTQIEADLREIFVYKDNSWETLLERATARACGVASAQVIKELTVNAAHLFPIALLVSTRSDSGNDLVLKDLWVWHSYFLVQDREGIWYAGSPANYKRGEVEESRLTRIISNQDLNVVIEEVEKLEGGYWPYELEIMSKFRGKLDWLKPEIIESGEGRKIRFAEIYYEFDDVGVERHENEI